MTLPCLVCRPWPAGVTSRCPACQRPHETGSFPLMAIAREFGVDYGDILLIAHAEAGLYSGSLASPRRFDLAHAASDRCYEALSRNQYSDLYTAICQHAKGRWA